MLPLNMFICKRPKGTKLLVTYVWVSHSAYNVCVCVRSMFMLLSMPENCNCLLFPCPSPILRVLIRTGIYTIAYIHKKYLHLKLVSNQIDTNHSQLLLLFHPFVCSFVNILFIFFFFFFFWSAPRSCVRFLLFASFQNSKCFRLVY